ncbi:hypothetical protein P8452_12989 [Trifolium repens]|nr:hypothetical protein P8452_12989 [Trifolium repens]
MLSSLVSHFRELMSSDGISDEHVQLAALKLALELGDGFITCRHRDASGHLLSSSHLYLCHDVLCCIASSADPNVVLDILNILLYHKIRWVISLQDGGTAVRWLKVLGLLSSL